MTPVRVFNPATGDTRIIPAERLLSFMAGRQVHYQITTLSVVRDISSDDTPPLPHGGVKSSPARSSLGMSGVADGPQATGASFPGRLASSVSTHRGRPHP